MKKINCPLCNKELSSNSLGNHFLHIHKQSYLEYKIKNNLPLNNKNKYGKKQLNKITNDVIYHEDSINLCQYGCNQIAKYQLKNSKWCCCLSVNSCLGMKQKNSNINKQNHNNNSNLISPFCNPKNRYKWDKGPLNKEHKQKISSALKGNPNLGRALRPEKEIERKRKISEKAKLNNVGGYRKGSGRGKKGWYKGYWCDSSWELAFVIYNLEHNISFTRNTEKFEYEFEGKKHYYIPDFVMEDESYVEIKGYETEQTLAKYTVCSNLKVLKEKDLKFVFEYVISKYGNDYIKLYE